MLESGVIFVYGPSASAHGRLVISGYNLEGWLLVAVRDELSGDADLADLSSGPVASLWV